MVDYKISRSHLSDELDNYVTTIKGAIGDCDEADKVESHGEIKATLYNLADAYDDGESVFDMFDYNSQEQSNYYAELFCESGSIYQYLVNDKDLFFAYDWPECYWNILFIDSLKINPAFRRRKRGLAAIYRTIQKFGGSCKLVIIYAKPQQFNEELVKESPELKLSEFEQDEKRATKKLKQHYAKLGFQEVPNSNYMIMNLENRRPTLRDIGFEK